jgi:O-antigen/teichoic acid export membrane protein
VKYDFKAVFIASALDKGIFTLLLMFFLFSDYTPTLSTLVLLKASTHLLGGFMLYLKSDIPTAFNFSWNWCKKIINYGKFVFVTSIGSIILRSIDIWMIGYYLNPGSVAAYSIAVRVSNLFEIPSNSIASVIFSKTVKKLKKHDSVVFKITYEKAVSTVLTLMLPLVFMVFISAESIIFFLSDSQYLEAIPILKVLIFTGIFLPFNKFYGILLEANNQVMHNSLLVVRNMLINIFMNMIMISYFGLVGAAVATLTSYVFIFLINQYNLHKDHQVSWKNYFNYVISHYTKAFLFIVNKTRFRFK